MNASEFGCGAGHQLAITAAKAGWEIKDFSVLTQSEEKCRQVLLFLRNQAEIKIPKYIIDFDKAPSVPNGWSILPDSEQLPNRVHGTMKLDPKKIALHLDNGQRGNKWIKGNDLRKKLEKLPVYGAQLGDLWYANQDLIPEEYKGKAIFFWGTIYRNASGDLCVRCLCWDGDRWGWGYCWLGDGWISCYPAAVLAS